MKTTNILTHAIAGKTTPTDISDTLDSIFGSSSSSAKMQKNKGSSKPIYNISRMFLYIDKKPCIFIWNFYYCDQLIIKNWHDCREFRRQKFWFGFFSVILVYISSMLSVETFWDAGHKVTGNDVDGSLSLVIVDFKRFFGTSPLVCVVAWDIMSMARPRTSRPEHLLWALLLLKRYGVEDINTSLIGISEKTIQMWSHICINLLEDMPL